MHKHFGAENIKRRCHILRLLCGVLKHESHGNEIAEVQLKLSASRYVSVAGVFEYGDLTYGLHKSRVRIVQLNNHELHE